MKLYLRRVNGITQIKSQNAYTARVYAEDEEGNGMFGTLMISYQTPVAAQLDGVWYFDPVSYSTTTSKQITQFTGYDSKERKAYLKEYPERAATFIQ